MKAVIRICRVKFAFKIVQTTVWLAQIGSLGLYALLLAIVHYAMIGCGGKLPKCMLVRVKTTLIANADPLTRYLPLTTDRASLRLLPTYITLPDAEPHSLHSSLSL